MCVPRNQRTDRVSPRTHRSLTLHEIYLRMLRSVRSRDGPRGARRLGFHSHHGCVPGWMDAVTVGNSPLGIQRTWEFGPLAGVRATQWVARKAADMGRLYERCPGRLCARMRQPLRPILTLGNARPGEERSAPLPGRRPTWVAYMSVPRTRDESRRRTLWKEISSAPMADNSSPPIRGRVTGPGCPGSRPNRGGI